MNSEARSLYNLRYSALLHMISLILYGMKMSYPTGGILITGNIYMGIIDYNHHHVLTLRTGTHIIMIGLTTCDLNNGVMGNRKLRYYVLILSIVYWCWCVMVWLTYDRVCRALFKSLRVRNLSKDLLRGVVNYNILLVLWLISAQLTVLTLAQV